jgi:hypothetical protein
MAINFLNTVDLNQNQLDHARIVNEAGNVAAGTGVAGQLYFDTTADAGVGVLKVWTDQWVEVGGGVESLTNTSGTYVAFGTDNVSATGAVTLGTVDLTAVDGTSVLATRFLSKDNTWDVPAFDNYSGWMLDGDSGIAQTISSGDTALFTGGTKITTSVAATDTLTITHDAQAQTDTTSAVTANAFTVVNSVGVDSTGHVTGVDIKTVTVPDNNTTYDLTTAPTGTAVRLTSSDAGDPAEDVTISGTAGRTAMFRTNASTLRVDLTDSVIIVDDLTVGGVITQVQTGETNTLSSPLDMGGSTASVTPNKILNVATGIDATDGVNLGQVELLVAGIGVFQGGYNATTDPGVPVISGAANVKLDLGDYFVVSHDGDITFSGTTTTGVNSGALANSTALVLAAANTDVAVGMDVTGTGVPPGVTILTVTNSTNFVLSSAITIANTTTLTFSDKVVSVEVGDFIFANAAIAAASDPAASEYTIVQSDANIAGAGATDGATEKGVAGFDSATFDVSANGWVQLKPLANPYGTSVTLTSGADAGGETTFTVDVTALFGATASAANCKAEVLRVSDLVTVYPEVSRNGTGDILFKFVPVVADSAFKALITIV